MKFKEYLKEENNIEEKVLDFFMDVKNPTDKQVHKLADDLGISPHDLEQEIYELLSTFTSGGFAKEKGFKEEDADPKELKMGVDIEHEHLNKESKYAKFLAKRTTLDHLAEIPDYNSKLAKMEGEEE